MSNQEIAEAEARLAQLRADNTEKTPNPLFDSAASLFHRLVDLAPWHQESDKKAAHDAVEEHVAAPAQGRNETPAGVVEQSTPVAADNTGSADSFPGSTPPANQE